MKKEPRIEYAIYECPICKGKMAFEREPRGRKIQTVCAKCGKQWEFIVK